MAIPSLIGLCAGGNYSVENERFGIHRENYGVQRNATSLLQVLIEDGE